jgi:hypothetical protein
MSNMIIDVEFPSDMGQPGSIEFAVSEAQRKAIKWDVALVRFTLDGVLIKIGPNTDLREALSDYFEQREG